MKLLILPFCIIWRIILSLFVNRVNILLVTIYLELLILAGFVIFFLCLKLHFSGHRFTYRLILLAMSRGETAIRLALFTKRFRTSGTLKIYTIRHFKF